MNRIFRTLALPAVLGLVLLAPGTSHANHAWANYHWARTSNPFTIKMGNNLNSLWSPYLVAAGRDWGVTSGACNNPQNPVRATIVAGSSGNLKRCSGVTGTIQACNASYGGNGWLGLATISVNGDHITQGTVKLNDYYFNQPQYNTPAWRAFVCEQEVGHCFGLAHQDENFSNPKLLDACGRGTCMDYTNDPSNQGTPNQHDYDQLVTIYGHLDSFTTIGAGVPASANADVSDFDPEDQAQWGRAVGFANGRPNQFEREVGGGHKVVTFVLWAP